MHAIDPNDPVLAQRLVKLASDAVSMNNSDREKAEHEIKEFQNSVDKQTGFVLLLLNVAVASGPASSFCSIVFKNTVKTCWDAATAEHCITENDKAVVRDTITLLMLRAPPNVQRNLAEAITMIAEIDFPEKWPNALDRIVQSLMNEKDVAIQSAALSTAHSILGRYRSQTDLSEKLAEDLRIIYTTLTSPLLLSMEYLLGEMEKCNSSFKAACQGLTSAVECLRDMTTLDLGDEFIWNLNKFVDVLMRCLQFSSPVTDDMVLIELKSAVMACVTHFLLRFDEDFEKHAGGFMNVVWNTIASPSSRSSAMDDVVIQGINLLSAACRGSMRTVFDNTEVLENLVVQVILPNLALQTEDIELYERESDEYIQRDIEGSDLHTRRREAGELVRSLMVSFPDKSGPLFTAQLQHLMTAVASGDWKAKDLSIYLVSALALEGQYANTQRGASQQLSGLVPFESFLRHNILTELSSDVSSQSPFIIKADCIRFVATFRAHIDPQIIPDVVALLTSWIRCPDEVVHAYAAHAVERILTVRRPGQQELIISDANMGDKVAPLLQHLCMRLQQDKRPCAYTMQCLLRVSQNCSHSVKPFVGDIITCIAPVVQSNAKNPSNPLFSHCMFEVISKCIQLRPEDAAAIEGALWEPMIFILQNDVLEYVPYTLQIMAQLLDTRSGGSPDPPAHYQALLEPLLVPDMYQQKGNIPAVVRLLVSFIEHYPRYVHSKGLTEKTLMIFRALLQYKNYDHEGFNILTSMVIAYPKDIIEPFMGSVYQALFQRLQTSRTPKYVRILIIFLSIVVVVHGANDVVTRINLIQNGLFWMLLQRVWLPNVQKILGPLERKVCVVALSCLLGECEELQQNSEVWTSCVVTCLKMIHGAVENDDVTSFTPKAHTMGDLKQYVDDSGFTNIFCPLQGAVRPPIDVCASVKQPHVYFRERVQQALRGPNGAHLEGLLRANHELWAAVQ
ncbi:putative CAS/CSE/importin domain protein [Trypanosoma theileri]|uniref:Putative CAS/CSE/importin domain protein n=1 Tax=Trypanosoma theileri TaxID=67003 RepID=A0A1X0P1D2_9TRYP|nr:putative CAS/CSE/importin domain protein [Trypanosoma theileri]ORC90715.1 putative CAS/CSE/importin domain protein [Trypanosoma theileri]